MIKITAFIAATLLLLACSAPCISANAAAPPTAHLFTCPDGKAGLHVLHTRFLYNRYGSNVTFIATRLLQMNTFFIASINAQTAANLIVYISYDERLSSVFLPVIYTVAAQLKYPVIHSAVGEEGVASGNVDGLRFHHVMQLIYDAGIIQKHNHPPIEIYLSSRLDEDDGGHVEAALGMQLYACQELQVEEIKQLSMDQGYDANGCGDFVRIMYAETPLLWHPDETTSFGLVGTWKDKFKRDRLLPIISSFVILGAHNVQRCPQNVHSYWHSQPNTVANLSTPECCFHYDRRKHLHFWQPSSGPYGGLKVRTAGAVTAFADKSGPRWPAEPNDLKRWFGVDPVRVAELSLLFRGLELQAPEVMKDNVERFVGR